MSPAILKFLGGLGLRLLPFVICAAVSAVMVQRREAKVIAHWRDVAATNARNAAGWEASFRASEALRKTEAAQASAAVAQLAGQCDARVAAARKSALALNALLSKEPARDPNGCPMRQLVDPDGLRDALGPAG